MFAEVCPDTELPVNGCAVDDQEFLVEVLQVGIRSCAFAVQARTRASEEGSGVPLHRTPSYSFSSAGHLSPLVPTRSPLHPTCSHLFPLVPTLSDSFPLFPTYSGVSSHLSDRHVRRHLSLGWIWGSLLRSAHRFTCGCARCVSSSVISNDHNPRRDCCWTCIRRLIRERHDQPSLCAGTWRHGR